MITEPGYVAMLNAMEGSDLWGVLCDFNTRYPDTPSGIRLAAAKGSVAECLRAGLLEVYVERGTEDALLPLSEAMDVVLGSESWQPTYPHETNHVLAATDEGRAMAPVAPDDPVWSKILHGL